MIAAEIPDGLLYGLIPVAFAGMTALIAWIVRELGKITVQNARTEERHEDHERRLVDLEEWRRERRPS